LVDQETEAVIQVKDNCHIDEVEEVQVSKIVIQLITAV